MKYDYSREDLAKLLARVVRDNSITLEQAEQAMRDYDAGTLPLTALPLPPVVPDVATLIERIQAE